MPHLTSDTYLAATDDDCNHAGPTMGDDASMLCRRRSHGGGSGVRSEVRWVAPL